MDFFSFFFYQGDLLLSTVTIILPLLYSNLLYMTNSSSSSELCDFESENVLALIWGQCFLARLLIDSSTKTKRQQKFLCSMIQQAQKFFMVSPQPSDARTVCFAC